MAPKSKTKIAKNNAAERPSQPAQTILPDWPQLTPVLAAADLETETLEKDQIILIRKLLTANLCNKFVAFLSSLPLVTTPGKPKVGEAVRVNDRFQVQDHAFAQRLWEQTALKELVTSYADQSAFQGEILGLNPNIRIYRYRPGQFFGEHYDESNKLDFGPDKTPAKTTWTLLIYLTVCEGGETIFYPERVSRNTKAPAPIIAAPEIGLALFHRHGDDCLLHAGMEVKSGEKWVIRSDLVVKR